MKKFILATICILGISTFFFNVSSTESDQLAIQKASLHASDPGGH